jgi:hypothetical protein
MLATSSFRTDVLIIPEPKLTHDAYTLARSDHPAKMRVGRRKMRARTTTTTCQIYLGTLRQMHRRYVSFTQVALVPRVSTFIAGRYYFLTVPLGTLSELEDT